MSRQYAEARFLESEKKVEGVYPLASIMKNKN